MSKNLIALASVLLAAFVTIRAQSVKDSSAQPTVTAATTEQGMRFTAPADAVEMRLEIFSAAGNKVFDTEFRRGNVLDWRTQDSAGLSTEPHLWVVTVKTLAGQLRQRHGTVSWKAGRASAQRVAREQLTGPQTQAWELSRAAQSLPPLNEDPDAASFNLLSEQTTPAATVTAHDAQTGQVTSTTGALTFRTGDVFTGKDVERMRITENGKVGIGTDQPKATLDVAGTVRVSGGIKFPDGTTLSSTDGKLIMRDAKGESITTANLAGTGTQNQVAKWIDNAGTLGDSAITEVSGNVGIGLTNPAAKLHVFGNLETVRQQLSNTNSFIQFGFYEGAVKKGAFGFQGSTSVGFIGGPGAMVFGTLTASPVAFFTSGIERVRVDSAGNVGVGTSAPTAKLHVVGTVNLTGLRTEGTSDPNVVGGKNTNNATPGVIGATISGGGGGAGNRVTDNFGTVGGGSQNRAGDDAGTTNDKLFATVSGGAGNIASGTGSTVPGGSNNTAQGSNSFAAGRRAKALHNGSFVWGDSTDADFSSTNLNQFLIRATAVGININNPTATLHVSGSGLFTGNLTVNGTVSLPADSITDAMVSNTLTVDGGTINNTVIGGTTPAAGTFTTLNATSGTFSGTVNVDTLNATSVTSGGLTVDTNTLHVDAPNNRVGIGTTSPTAKLEVSGNVKFTGLRTEFALVPNVVAGDAANNVTAGVTGASIGGGGSPALPNRVTDSFGTVGGGNGNRAGDDAGTIVDRNHATVGGGFNNTASGSDSTVPGGSDNTAQGNFSFAAGRRAKALDQGAFVWGDSTNADFSSTANNQFLIRAGGGVGIDTNAPAAKLHVAGNVNFTGLRTEATSDPNVIGGKSTNNASLGVIGATIGGGGSGGTDANVVTDDHGTVAGGIGNRAGDNAGLTDDRRYATVGGGNSNIASGSASTVGGGNANTASGFRSTVPGGFSNTAQGDYSFAAGRQAKANNTGAFVWGDSTAANFSSTADDQFLIRAGGGVGIGTNAPTEQLHVVGNGRFTGNLKVNTLAAATATNLCINGSTLADCSSSLRYKERVAPLFAGLGLLNRLRPVTFKWKGREERDLGLIAEEVNRVEPLLVTRNSAGEVQGVKYDQLSVVLINAVKQQQEQIERQEEQIKKQQSLIEGLKRLVCRDNPNADVCR